MSISALTLFCEMKAISIPEKNPENSIEISYTDLPAYLNDCNKPVYGALLDGESIWSGTPLQLPSEGAVLVVGNESRGITPEVQQHITHRIAIPNLGGTAESLNASVACAILMAELLK